MTRTTRHASIVAYAAVALVAVVATVARPALGEPRRELAQPTRDVAPEPVVDVAVHEAPPPRRHLAIAWNPLALLTIGKLSADVVVAPVAHHALVLSPFYASTTTAPIAVFDDAGNGTQLPAQRFRGYGGELGYRYYAGDGGLRGLFVGPSLIVGTFDATAGNGEKSSFLDIGVAADVGYQALVADRVALAIGAGAQYVATSKSLPEQQLPARLYANSGLRPRLLFSMGWAF